MKPTPPLPGRAGEHERDGEPYILRHGDTLYRVTAASARDATAEVLAFLDDPNVWRGEIEVWNEAYYREAHGEPSDVVDVENEVAETLSGRDTKREAKMLRALPPECRELVNNAVLDSGAPFEPSAVAMLKKLRGDDLAAWQRMRALLGEKAKVSVTALDAATAPANDANGDPGPGAFPSGYYVEAACPVCRPGAVADGARPVRCILHGGDDAIQPTNASASGFRLAGEAGETAGWIVRTGDRDVAAGAAPMEAADRARRIGHDDGHLRPATAAELDSLDLPPSALGIEAGAAPWWRPLPAPEAPEGAPDRAVYLPAGADAWDR